MAKTGEGWGDCDIIQFQGKLWKKAKGWSESIVSGCL